MLAALFFSCKSAKLGDAEEKQRVGEYYEAASIYRKVYAKTSPMKRDLRGYIAYRMGDCYRMSNNTARSLSAYMNALRYDYPDSILYLRLGQMYQKSGKYTEALKYYDQYHLLFPEDLLAINGIKGSELALDWKKKPTRYVVKRMDKLNSTKGEFGIMYYPSEKHDVLYFNSSRSKGGDEKINGITGTFNNDFFVVKQNEKGEWLAPEELEDEVNTVSDEGTPSFSPDGNTMYYTYCADATDGNRVSEIYTSSRSGAKWAKGTRVELARDSLTSFGHPAVSPDGKYLYYVSDAIGGYGGKDIYRSRITENGYGAMENLGPAINTAGNELFPYVRDSVTFYFASDGHPGMGGLDLFKASLDSTGHWCVENMKYPLNSSDDDFGITFRGTDNAGFFCSNRNDARGFDHIYSFEYPVVTIFIEGYVFDVEEYPVTNATVRIVGKDGLNVKVPVKNDGSYRVELERDIRYVMMASADGFLNQNFELKTDPDERNETYIVDFFLSPTTKPVVVDNIFYDFDKATLRPESTKALDGIIKVLNDNPNVTIELSAHTDRKGSDSYNEKLAQQRAQSVVNYLIAGGISSERLTAKGYGKSMPKVISKRISETYPFLKEGDVLSETFVLSLTPEQQEVADQLNRRTEFKVVRTDYNMY